MRNSLTYLKALAYPVGWVYAVAVRVRNRLYDSGVWKSERYGRPVLSVGNITAGGTGKTPHVEYLLHLLEKEYRVAMVSRGYKRASRGYQEASAASDSLQLGDEPYQIYRKHKRDVAVAVDKDRRHAIRTLLAARPGLQVFVLDDAFQYRKIHPGLSILLMDYNRMVEDDRMLPYGMLREPASSKDRADVLVVSKCPENLNPAEARLLRNKVRPKPYQKLFFSTFRYGQLRGVFDTGRKITDQALAERHVSVLICAAIAEPGPLEAHVKRLAGRVRTLYFPDHHYMDRDDVAKMRSLLDGMPGTDKIVVVTDKDAAKLCHNPYLTDELKEKIYCLPLKVKFLREGTGSFDKTVKDYVAENS